MVKIADLISKRKQILIDFPEYDDHGKAVAKVILQMPTQLEVEEVITEAAKETDVAVRGLDKNDPLYTAIYNKKYQNTFGRLLLHKVCRDPENPQLPLFITKEQVGDLSHEQTDFLSKEFEMFKNGKPFFSLMTKDEFEKAVNDIHKDVEAGANFLEHRLLSNTLTNFIIYLVEELWKSRQMVDGLQQMNK